MCLGLFMSLYNKFAGLFSKTAGFICIVLLSTNKNQLKYHLGWRECGAVRYFGKKPAWSKAEGTFL